MVGSAASVFGAVAFGLAALAPTGDLLLRLFHCDSGANPASKPGVEAFFEQCAAFVPPRICPAVAPEIVERESPLQLPLLGFLLFLGLGLGVCSGVCVCRSRAQSLERKVEKLQARTRDLARLQAENIRLRRTGAITI